MDGRCDWERGEEWGGWLFESMRRRERRGCRGGRNVNVVGGGRGRDVGDAIVHGFGGLKRIVLLVQWRAMSRGCFEVNILFKVT